MRVWLIDQLRRALDRSERDDPRPAPGQVLVRVHAVALNYHDLLTLDPPHAYKPPVSNLIAASDGAGEIVEVGEGVTQWRVGDRVCASFYPYWRDGDIAEADLRVLGDDVDGMLADYVALDAGSVVGLPDYMSYEEGCTLPCAALTAWSAVSVCGQLRRGQTMLTLGTGGVSLFALQIAKQIGAQVVVTSSSDAKLERARALGADQVLNYRDQPDWGSLVAQMTGGGVDLVVETGGSGTFQRSIAAAKLGGTISLVGMVDMTPSTVTPFDLFFKNLHLHGIRVGSGRQLADLCDFLSAHHIRPVIDRVFAFDEAREAYAHLKSGAHFGKVVIRVAE